MDIIQSTVVADKPGEVDLNNSLQWQAVRMQLKSSVSALEFETWLKGLRLEGTRMKKGGTIELLLSVLKPITKKTIEKNYKDVLHAACLRGYENFSNAYLVERSIGQRCMWPGAEHKIDKEALMRKLLPQKRRTSSSSPLFGDIKQVILSHFQVAPDEFTAHTKSARINHALDHIYFFACELGGCTHGKIALLTSSTVEDVITGIEHIQKMQRSNQLFRDRLTILEKQIRKKALSSTN